MAFPRHLLLDEEQLIFDLKPHWVAVVPAVLWAIVTVIASVFAYDFVDDQGWGWGRTAVLVAVGLSLFFFSVLPIMRWLFTNFVLTSDRVITRQGIIAKHAKEIPLERINDVAFNQTVIERMIGAGDLLIESAGERGQTRISDVRKPEEVQKTIYRATEDNSTRMMRPVVTEEAPDSIPEQLEALCRLRTAGT
ncbi:MAG TPA: PH domain-containing protein, partial [Actinomycetota bacterium]